MALSRRTFLGVAAAVGGIGSMLGFSRVSHAHPARSKSGGPPDLHRNPPATLHEWSLMCLRLHKHFSKANHPNYAIKAPPSLDLVNDATSYRFSAELINNIADNTLHVRDHIRRCEPIRDQTAWPVPKPIEPIPSGGNIDALTTSTIRWITIENKLFGGILDSYGMTFESLDPSHDDLAPRPFFHDELYRMATNAVDFIKFENEKWPNDQHFIFEGPPAPPAPGAEDDTNRETKNLWLIKLEWGFHRLVQAHMEIGSFIPTHLTLAAARACANPGASVRIK